MRTFRFNISIKLVILTLSLNLWGCDTQFQETLLEQLPDDTAKTQVSRIIEKQLEHHEHPHHKELPNIPNIPKLVPNQNPVVSIPDFTPISSNTNTNTTPINLTSPFLPLSSINQQSSGGGGGSNSSIRATSESFSNESNLSTTKETPQPNHELTISDIFLTETGESIASDSTGDASLIPSFDGKTLSITITGNFKTAPKTTLDNMQFINEPGLIHQSVVTNEIPIMILLNDVILWKPVEASETRIVAELDSKGLVDLYLKGSSHVISVVGGKLLAKKRIRVGEPEVKISLNPTIESIEVLLDENQQPENLLIKGKNLMSNYRFAFYQVNGKPVFGHSTNVLEDNNELMWETVVHLPTDFENNTNNEFVMVTPFGLDIKNFEGV